MTYEVDPDEHPETQDSIKWAEMYYGQHIGNPRIENVTETWQFIPANKSQDTDNHVYDMDPDLDSDVKTTLKSGTYGEDWYGYNHPNRFTGRFNDEGKYTGGQNQGGYGGHR